MTLAFCQQAAQKTNDIAGDGTTTATILSAAIIAEGMKIVAAGTNPVQLTRGIEKTVAALVKELQKISVDVTDDDLINVATVSAGGNEVVRADYNSNYNTIQLPSSVCHNSHCGFDAASLADEYRGRINKPSISSSFRIRAAWKEAIKA